MLVDGADKSDFIVLFARGVRGVFSSRKLMFIPFVHVKSMCRHQLRPLFFRVSQGITATPCGDFSSVKTALVRLIFVVDGPFFSG
jgi:hypothetical protein